MSANPEPRAWPNAVPLGPEVGASRRLFLNDLMDKSSFDAIALLETSNVTFVSNFFVDVMPWERPILAIVPRNGEPFMLLNELSTNSFRFTRDRRATWIEDVEFYAEHPRIDRRAPVVTQWDEHIVRVLAARGLSRARIGFDGTRLLRAASALPDLQLVPISEQLRTWRQVKTAQEHDLLRAATRLSDWAQERYRENIAVGRFVQELDYFTMAQTLAEAGRRWPQQRVEMVALGLRGADSAAPHGTGAWTGSVIEEGDGIVNIFVVRVNGLTVENERTWFCGTPSQAQAEALDVVNVAHSAALECITPQHRVCDFDAAAHRVFCSHEMDQYVQTRAGHGIGLDNHEFPDETAFDTRRIESGEVFAVEPGIYIWGLGGFRNSDTVIAADSPEVLNSTPRDVASQTVAPRVFEP